LQANEVTVEEILAQEYISRQVITYLRENDMLTVKPPPRDNSEEFSCAGKK
jgi:hypothetical protein